MILLPKSTSAKIRTLTFSRGHSNSNCASAATTPERRRQVRLNRQITIAAFYFFTGAFSAPFFGHHGHYFFSIRPFATRREQQIDTRTSQGYYSVHDRSCGHFCSTVQCHSIRKHHSRIRSVVQLQSNEIPREAWLLPFLGLV